MDAVVLFTYLLGTDSKLLSNFRYLRKQEGMTSKMTLTLEEWRRETRLVQQNFSDMLGDRTWDEFDLTDDNGQDFLFAKIAFSLFGPAPPAPDSDNIVVDNPNHHTYTDEQVAKVTNMQEKITKHQSPTKVSSQYLAASI